MEHGVETVVFRDGVVLPVDHGFSEHTALAIRGNRILRVGSTEEVMSAAGPDARLVDLSGRTVLPGFIEPHMHFALVAGMGHLEDVGAVNCPTFGEARDALRGIAAGPAASEWVAARQYDPVLLDPPRDLTTNELDEIAPDRPAIVLNASGHIAYANTRALQIAGITDSIEDSPGAGYGRHENGTLNGVLYGPAAYLPVIMANPDVASRATEGAVEAGLEVTAAAAALGITTLCDQATGASAGEVDLVTYREMADSGRMKARIRASLYDSPDWDDTDVAFGQGDDLARIVGWKIVTDGSNQGFTGRQRQPYVGTDSVGIFYVEPETLKEKVATRAAQGWPVVMHGNGDAAIDSILDATEAAKDAGIDVESLRFRIEHCSILHDDQIRRIKALGMTPSFLINHVHYWGHVMRDRVFGSEKVLLLDRCASVERAGIPWSMHTDAPVSPLGTLHKIRVAVARDLWKEPDTVLAPDERVSVEAAIRAITSTAAWQCHSEDVIGSLEPGKLADFVILEDDPRSVQPAAISDITVSETWMDGQRVYQA
jgi:predicted amidohydrolase YtcJ